MKKRQWVYRPTDDEHEALLRKMAENPEYTSIAQVVREAVLRFVHDDYPSAMFSQLSEIIQDLRAAQQDLDDIFLQLKTGKGGSGAESE